MVQGTPHPDDPFNEAVATTGLFLIFAAIIAVAFALASWGAGEALIATVAGVAALASFAACIFCFKSQATDSTPVEVSV